MNSSLRLSHVAAVRRHLPELADQLETLGLMAAENPDGGVVELWKQHDGPRLTAPTQLSGLGATCVETVELQRGIGYLSPSLAAATTMHYLSVAGLVDFAETADETTVGLVNSSSRTGRCSHRASPRGRSKAASFGPP